MALPALENARSACVTAPLALLAALLPLIQGEARARTADTLQGEEGKARAAVKCYNHYG